MHSFRVNLMRPFLVLLWIIVAAIGGCLNPEDPPSKGAPADDTQLVSTGVSYTLPGKKAPDPAAPLSSNSFTNWYRYPAETQSWMVMSGATAYSRDVLVGGETYISGAADGETWTASAVRPDGMTINWGAITFCSDYSGQQNCFVSPNWYICNTTSLYVLWYVSSQCATPGEWTMRFSNNGVQFYEGTFNVLPQIPPGTIPVLYNQLSYADHYDNRCWKTGSNPRRTTVCDTVNTEQATIAQLGCFLTGSA
jgi:hypothetical protein